MPCLNYTIVQFLSHLQGNMSCCQTLQLLLPSAAYRGSLNINVMLAWMSCVADVLRIVSIQGPGMEMAAEGQRTDTLNQADTQVSSSR